MDMKIAIGSDHGGFTLKENLKEFLAESGYQFIDCGTNSEESVDYPKFAYTVAKKIADGEDYKMPATIEDPAILEEITDALKVMGYTRRR